MNKPLKISVQEHLRQKKLSNQQLSQLHRLQDNYRQNHRTVRSAKRVRTLALLSVVLFVILVVPLFKFALLPNQSMQQRIAEEVAGNHLKLKPLETSANNMQGIIDYFQQLDFLPVKPEFFNSGNYVLLGGRYCSIQGVTAAQLRIKNRQTGALHSLYETQYDPKVFDNLPKLEQGTEPLSVYAKGMKVKIWIEKDVLFALTDSGDTGIKKGSN